MTSGSNNALMASMRILFFVALSIFSSAAFGVGAIPNILCQYVEHADGWHFRSAEKYTVQDAQGKTSFANIYAAFYEEEVPGSGICMGRDKNAAGEIVAFKMFTYSYETEFAVFPMTCEVATSGSYQVIQSVRVTPSPGLTSEITMNGSADYRLKYLNYFLTESEATLWPMDMSLPEQKCRQLFPAAK